MQKQQNSGSVENDGGKMMSKIIEKEVHGTSAALAAVDYLSKSCNLLIGTITTKTCPST